MRPYLQLGGEPENGKPIAIIRGGENDKEIIYLCENFDNKPNSDNKGSLTKQQMTLVDQIIKEQLKLHATDNKMKQRAKNAEILRRTMKTGGKIKDEILSELYEIIKMEFERKKNFEIEIDDGNIEIIPNIDGRQCAYAAAPSGSGKSYWVKKYAMQYNKLFPENKVYLFSKVDDDISLKGIQNYVKVDLDFQIVDDPIDATELANSLVIFDDTDTVKDKAIRKAIGDLKDDLLETGRHNSTYVVITSHLINNYKETRTVLNESHVITVYPSSGSSYQIKYCLKNYFGLDNEDIAKIFKLDSRWVSVYKNYPQMVVSEHKIYLLGNNE
jgi:hypothetical protein